MPASEREPRPHQLDTIRPPEYFPTPESGLRSGEAKRVPLVESQIAAQAAAHGIPAERVVEDVLLAPQAVKALLEPDDVAAAVSFLLGPAGCFATGSPLVLDAGWSAR